MTPEDPEAAKMLDELRRAVADRPAHARRLARLETVAGAALRDGWHVDLVYAALASTDPTENVSVRMAEALLADLRWIINAGGDRDRYLYPDAYAKRRAVDRGRRKQP